MIFPPKLYLHNMKSEKIREAMRPNLNLGISNEWTVEVVDHNAIRATIKEADLDAYEKYYDNYMEENRLRRQNPALEQAWFQYQILLSLYR